MKHVWHTVANFTWFKDSWQSKTCGLRFFKKTPLKKALVWSAMASMGLWSINSVALEDNEYNDNYEIFNLVSPSPASFVVSKALMPQGPRDLIFNGLTIDELGPSVLYDGFEYRNFRMYRGALKVEVYQGGQFLAEHTFLRSHLLQDVNLRVLNRQFTSRLSMPEENGELTEAQFFLPFLNECGEESGALRKAKIAGQNYYFVPCSKFGSNFFMTRQQRGIGIVQTLGGQLEYEATVGTDSGRQNMVVTDYVLATDGARLPGDMFKILSNIPMPIATANYFLSSDYDFDDSFVRQQNFKKSIEADIQQLSGKAEDYWLGALATSSSYTKGSQGGREKRQIKTYGISRNNQSDMKLLRHAPNYIGNSISYFGTDDKKKQALSVTFTPLLAGYQSIKDLAENISNEQFCLGKEGFQKTTINGVEAYQIECKYPFGSKRLKKTFLLIPVKLEGAKTPKGLTPEEALALESFELVMLLGNLSATEVADVVGAVTLSQGWNWNLDLHHLSEFDRAQIIAEIAQARIWYDDSRQNPDSEQGEIWVDFIKRVASLMEGNTSKDPVILRSIFRQAAEDVKEDQSVHDKKRRKIED